jgi:hypothetical protein
VAGAGWGNPEEETAMMYEEVIRDFAWRTRKNLETIDRLHAEGQETYEVTQLVNSTLGLIVFPEQEWFNHIPTTPLEQLRREDWPIPRVVGSFPQVTDFQQLMRYLRNAIAHFNIRFIGDGRKEIHLLSVWNTDPRTKRKTWEAELSVADLRKIAERFIEFLLEQPHRLSRSV